MVLLSASAAWRCPRSRIGASRRCGPARSRPRWVMCPLGVLWECLAKDLRAARHPCWRAARARIGGPTHRNRGALRPSPRRGGVTGGSSAKLPVARKAAVSSDRQAPLIGALRHFNDVGVENAAVVLQPLTVDPMKSEPEERGHQPIGGRAAATAGVSVSLPRPRSGVSGTRRGSGATAIGPEITTKVCPPSSARWSEMDR